MVKTFFEAVCIIIALVVGLITACGVALMMAGDTEE